jgi:uncharacterized membrane protein required for colicin V production
MHILDILFIAAAGFFIFTGTRRGLIGEVFRLAGLAGGFVVAFLYFKELGQLIRFNPPHVANAAAFTIIFIVAFLAIIAAGRLLKKCVHLTPLGWIDAVFGGIIGGAKSVLVFWVICLSAVSLPPTKFVRDMHQSFVFKTYKKLPPAAKLSGLMKIRAQFKNDRGQAVSDTKKQ